MSKKKRVRRKGKTVTCTIVYDGRLFDGLDYKKATSELREWYIDETSGSKGNPFYIHYLEGQMEWQPNNEKWQRYKEKKTGSTEIMKYTGEFLSSIRRDDHPNRRTVVKYYDDNKTFKMYATVSKMNKGKNVYQINQAGRFKGFDYKKDGDKKFIAADEFIKADKEVALAYKAAKAAKALKRRDTKRKFRNRRLQEKIGYDKGSMARVSNTTRMVTINKPGDERYISKETLNDTLVKLLKDQGYKVD